MRDSNMELCRFVSILLIVMLHTGFQNFGVPTNITDTTPPLLLMQALCNVGVDVFVLITGFYSSRLKTKSFVNLIYICLFYAVVAILIGCFSSQPLQLTKIFFISKSNWFIPSYICLLAVAPFINKACDLMSKKELMGGVLTMGFFLTWFGWLPALPDVSIGVHNGCSVISFSYLYIIGRYIRINGLTMLNAKRSILIYVTCAVCIAGLAYTALYLGGNYGSIMNPLIQRIYANNNPLMIISAIAFFSFFKSLRMKNSKGINFFAKSTLSVLLLHGSGQFAYFMMPFFQNLYNEYNGIVCAVLWILSVISIGLIAVVIDQVRIYTYNHVSPFLIIKAEKIVDNINKKIIQ